MSDNTRVPAHKLRQICFVIFPVDKIPIVNSAHYISLINDLKEVFDKYIKDDDLTLKLLNIICDTIIPKLEYGASEIYEKAIVLIWHFRYIESNECFEYLSPSIDIRLTLNFLDVDIKK